MARTQSAGVILYRYGDAGLELLLVHPGGPFWARRDDGAWSMPKGEFAESERAEDAARRELAEEIGVVCDRLEPLFPVRYADASTQLIGRAFLAYHDGPVVLQASEIVEGAFVPIVEAERIMRDERCCPDGAEVLRRYLAGARPAD